MACFGKHVAYVEADGASGDVEGVGDFLVGFVSAHEAEDVQFSSDEAGVVEAEGGSFLTSGKRRSPLRVRSMQSTKSAALLSL